MNAIGQQSRHLDYFPEILKIELSQASPCHICKKDNAPDCLGSQFQALPSLKDYRDISDYPCDNIRDKTLTGFYGNMILRTFSALYAGDHPERAIDPEFLIELRKENPDKDTIKQILHPEYEVFLNDFLRYVHHHPELEAWEVIFDTVSLFTHARLLAMIEVDHKTAMLH